MPEGTGGEASVPVAVAPVSWKASHEEVLQRLDSVENNPPAPQTSDDGSAILAYEAAKPIFDCYNLSKWGEELTEDMKWRFDD